MEYPVDPLLGEGPDADAVADDADDADKEDQEALREPLEEVGLKNG